MELVQVTHNDDHSAELTVKMDAETLETSLKNVAKKFSKEYRIPGFRPGKAPYHVIERAVGRDTLIAEVVDNQLQDLYQFALETAEIDPYAPGEVLDVDADDGGLIIKFTVVKWPVVELSNYRDIRLDYEVKPVTDEMVEETIDRVQVQSALSETVDRMAEWGDMARLTIHAYITPEEDIEDESTSESDNEEAPDNREMFMHEHNYDVPLFESKALELVMPGFNAQIVGLAAGDTKEFTLVVPDDDSEANEELRGRPIDFEIEVEQVMALILPPKNDLMALVASDGEAETLDAYRDRIREFLEQNAEETAENNFADEVVEKIVTESEVTYPEQMLNDYLDREMQDLDASLRNQYGMGLEDYLKVSGQSQEQLREDRRDDTLGNMRRTLILQKVLAEEELLLSEEALNQEIDKELAQYGELASVLRDYLYKSDEQRDSFGSKIVSERLKKRLIDIAKGLNPPKGPDPEEPETTDEVINANEETIVPQAGEDDDNSE